VFEALTSAGLPSQRPCPRTGGGRIAAARGNQRGSCGF